MTEQFIAGIVGQPFGLEGFVKVKPFSGDIENLLKLRNVILRRGTTMQKLLIEESSALAPFALLRFAGICSPELAKALTGAELLVGRAEASPLAADEFYVEDLKGLTVIAAPDAACLAGKSIGLISDIVEGGGGELVEIKLTGGELRLVPFRKEFFPEINPESGKVVLSNLWILDT